MTQTLSRSTSGDSIWKKLSLIASTAIKIIFMELAGSATQGLALKKSKEFILLLNFRTHMSIKYQRTKDTKKEKLLLLWKKEIILMKLKEFSTF